MLKIPQDLTMHSDAADVGYGGTLGFEEARGPRVCGRVKDYGRQGTARSRFI